MPQAAMAARRIDAFHLDWRTVTARPIQRTSSSRSGHIHWRSELLFCRDYHCPASHSSRKNANPSSQWHPSLKFLPRNTYCRRSRCTGIGLCGKHFFLCALRNTIAYRTKIFRSHCCRSTWYRLQRFHHLNWYGSKIHGSFRMERNPGCRAPAVAASCSRQWRQSRIENRGNCPHATDRYIRPRMWLWG